MNMLEVVRGFVEACRREDLAAVVATLDADVVAVCDGGGQVPATLGVVHGVEAVARLVVGLFCGLPGTELTVESVNGQAGVAVRRDGRAVAVVGVEVAGTAVTRLWIVLNPAKLRGWNRQPRGL
jgi:RNA polymerase sigma-70 factor (ECF subfamily)